MKNFFVIYFFILSFVAFADTSSPLRIPTNEIQNFLPAYTEKLYSQLSEADKNFIYQNTIKTLKAESEEFVENNSSLHIPAIRLKIVELSLKDILNLKKEVSFDNANVIIFRSKFNHTEIVCSIYTENCEESDLPWTYPTLSTEQIVKRSISIALRLKLIVKT